jgi:uncharacterized membrane protein
MEHITKLSENTRSWGEFADTKQFKVPKDAQEAQERVTKNFGRFSTNYIIFMLLISLPLTTYVHPYFLLVLALGGATAYALFVHFAKHSHFSFQGKAFHLSHQHRVIITIAVTILALFLTSSVAILFYTAIFGAVLGLLHSIFRKPTMTEQVQDTVKKSLDKAAELAH